MNRGPVVTEMSISAYLFVESMQGKAGTIVKAIRELDGVKDAHMVTGPHDVIVLVEVADMSVLGELTLSRIQSIPGVVRTLTNVVVDD